MNNLITTKQFVFSSILNSINTIIWLFFFLTTLNPKTFLFLTSISGDLNSIYLFLCLLCDISNYCCKSSKLEPLNDFLRNKLSNVINPMSYLVTILFWALFFMGGMDDMNTLYMILFNIYEHIFISIFVIVDIIISNHKRHFFSKIVLFFIYLYLFLYGIICGVATFVYDSPPYPFLKKIKYYILIIYCISFIVIAFLCYLLHILIYIIKDKYTNKKIILVNENERINTYVNRESSISK